jgi:hypothetical protein
MAHSTVMVLDDDAVNLELVSYALSRELPAIEIESVLSPGTALWRLEHATMVCC